MTIRLLLYLLLFASGAWAQPGNKAIRRDSVPEGRADKLVVPDVDLSGLMLTVRPGNSFYRDRMNSPTVLRATLDNMPVKEPDSSIHYSIRQSFRQPKRAYPLPQIVPK